MTFTLGIRQFALLSVMARIPPEPWFRPPVEATCALCGRAVLPAQADKHHLVPKSQGGRQTVLLHRICHRQIHALFSEVELATHYASIDALLQHEGVRRFVAWVRNKPPGFHERTRRSKR